MLTARLSAGVRANLQEEFTYYVRDVMNSQWLLCDAREAREYHSSGFPVHESYGNFRQVREWVDPRPAPNTDNAFSDQLESIDDAHQALEEEADPALTNEKRLHREGICF